MSDSFSGRRWYIAALGAVMILSQSQVSAFAQESLFSRIGTHYADLARLGVGGIGKVVRKQSDSTPPWMNYIGCEAPPATAPNPVPMPPPNQYTFTFPGTLTYKDDEYFIQSDAQGNCYPGTVTVAVTDPMPQFGMASSAQAPVTVMGGTCNGSTVVDTTLNYTWTAAVPPNEPNSTVDYDTFGVTWTYTSGESGGTAPPPVNLICHVIRAPVIQYDTQQAQAFSTFSPNNVWWYGNDPATGYPLNVGQPYYGFQNLVAFPQSNFVTFSPSLTYTWNVVQGPQYVLFWDYIAGMWTQGTYTNYGTSVDDATGQVYGSGGTPTKYNMDNGVQLGLTIACTDSGAMGCNNVGPGTAQSTYQMGVRAPYLLNMYTVKECIAQADGWECLIQYNVQDQYAHYMVPNPNGPNVGASETFSGAGTCPSEGSYTVVTNGTTGYSACVSNAFPDNNWWTLGNLLPCVDNGPCEGTLSEDVGPDGMPAAGRHAYRRDRFPARTGLWKYDKCLYLRRKFLGRVEFSWHGNQCAIPHLE